MGTWGTKPWESDTAADWFDNLMEETGLASYVEETLHHEIGDDPPVDTDEIRAAAAVLLLLGHLFVWPVEHWDEDLKLGISRLEEILSKDYGGRAEEQIRAEIALLKARFEHKPQGTTEKVKWWYFDE